MAAPSRNRVVWCDRGWFPTYYGFCPSEFAWRAEMKRLARAHKGNGSCAREPYPAGADARATTFDSANGQRLVIVTVADRFDKKMRQDPFAVAGLILHEAVHVWQALREEIGEKEPSREFEAYAIQHISLNLFWAYENTRLKKPKRPARKPKRASHRR